MRLQQKVFTFTSQGDKLGNSKLIVNGKESDHNLGILFKGIKREKPGYIKGYSILEFLNEKGEIQINDKIYTLSFKNGEEIIGIKSIEDPKDIILNDKELSADDENYFETIIESSAPVETPKQPQEDKTNQETEKASAEDSVKLFDNADYEEERDEQIENGYKELHTEPKSNYRLLVREETEDQDEDEIEKNIILIEILEDDYEIVNKDNFKIEINDNNFIINSK